MCESGSVHSFVSAPNLIEHSARQHQLLGYKLEETNGNIDII